MVPGTNKKTKRRTLSMPYWFEKLKIKLPKEKDRRRKLTDEDRETIKSLYKLGFGIREIARIFEKKCSRRLIQFILFPERLKRLAKQRDWRDYYDRDKHREYMRNHRKYKKEVLLNFEKVAKNN